MELKENNEIFNFLLSKGANSLHFFSSFPYDNLSEDIYKLKYDEMIKTILDDL